MEGLVRVRRDGPRRWHLIDKAKYDAAPDQFIVVDEHGEPIEATGGDDAELTIGRGPAGRWYVKRGKERIHGPYETEEEANAELAKLVGLRLIQSAT